MFELGGVSPGPAWSGPASDGRTAPETACYFGVRSAQRGDKREQSRYVGSCCCRYLRTFPFQPESLF